MNNKSNDERMSDEELDRELKRVQLQREKMQLEKEIARRQRANQVSKGLSAFGSALLNSFVRIFGRVIRFLRFIGGKLLIIVVTTTLVAGGLAGFMEFEETRKSKFYDDRNAYVDKTCDPPKSMSACDFDFGRVNIECYKQREIIDICRRGAISKFNKENTPFLIFKDL